MIPTIETFLVLFPLLIPVWEQRPLLPDDLFPTPYPIHMSGADIHMQRQGLGVVDAELRCILAQHLRQSGEPAAQEVLRSQLHTEKDPLVLATILQQFLFMPLEPPPVTETLAPLLNHPSPDVRFWAAGLYGRIRDANLATLAQMALKDTSPSARAAASATLLRRAADLEFDVLKGMIQATDQQVRADGLSAAMGNARVAELQTELLTACDDDNVRVRFAVAGGVDRVPDDLLQRLTAKLASDRNASVRSALVQAMGRRKSESLLPLLLSLAADPDAEVRRLVAEQLTAFPGQSTIEVLVRLFDDTANLVRCQAEDTLVAIHPQSPVITAVAARLGDANTLARYHVYRVLGRLNAREHDRAIHDVLKSEDRPENIGAVMFALGLLGARVAAPDIAAAAGHESSIVREEAARALGRLNDPTTFDTLNQLLFDKDKTVRAAALISAGWTGSGPAFSASLFKALKTFSDDQMTSENRAAACWAAGRLRPCDEELITQLIRQATTPVVPTPEGPQFEQDFVIVSAVLGLSQCGKDDPKVRSRAEAVHRKCSLDPSTLDPLSIKGQMLLPSPEVREFAFRQATAYMNGENIEPVARPKGSLVLQYGEYLPEEENP
ncbi:MAG: hypothetical protein A3K19_01130 [Lentisphaerae bacterium RIFOXYB12_FULL_65_16]|nr:MAG: hypothetical protein A3K18_21825 [Lentisphaerae bacterium RIFOXYA12_64_32]OGV93726.1 MAG: hypothetical protein A3K19_01130 [Lentisphaerae bacterium RIFOXYB12_FULL_65_16]